MLILDFIFIKFPMFYLFMSRFITFPVELLHYNPEIQALQNELLGIRFTELRLSSHLYSIINSHSIKAARSFAENLRALTSTGNISIYATLKTI